MTKRNALLDHFRGLLLARHAPFSRRLDIRVASVSSVRAIGRLRGENNDADYSTSLRRSPRARDCLPTPRRACFHSRSAKGRLSVNTRRLSRGNQLPAPLPGTRKPGERIRHGDKSLARIIKVDGSGACRDRAPFAHRRPAGMRRTPRPIGLAQLTEDPPDRQLAPR